MNPSIGPFSITVSINSKPSMVEPNTAFNLEAAFKAPSNVVNFSMEPTIESIPMPVNWETLDNCKNWPCKSGNPNLAKLFAWAWNWGSSCWTFKPMSLPRTAIDCANPAVSPAAMPNVWDKVSVSLAVSAMGMLNLLSNVCAVFSKVSRAGSALLFSSRKTLEVWYKALFMRIKSSVVPSVSFPRLAILVWKFSISLTVNLATSREAKRISSWRLIARSMADVRSTASSAGPTVQSDNFFAAAPVFS